MAEAERRQGRLTEAKELLLSCGGDEGLKSVWANNLAVTEEHLGLEDEAALHFREAASLNSERGEFNEALLKIFMQRETDILALAELSDKYADNPWGDFLYAVALQRSGRYEEAEKILHTLQNKLADEKGAAVLRMENGLAEDDIELLKYYAELYLGINFLHFGEPQRAAEFWERACDREPERIDYHYNYALALSLKDEQIQALAEAETARHLVHLRLSEAAPGELFGQRSRWEPVYYLLACMQEKCAHKQEALASFREWLRCFPDDPKKNAVERHIDYLTHGSR